MVLSNIIRYSVVHTILLRTELDRLIAHIREAVEGVFGSLSLKEEMSLEGLESLLESVRRRVEVRDESGFKCVQPASLSLRHVIKHSALLSPTAAIDRDGPTCYAA